MPFGKWKDFEECVRDFVSQGKDEESAKRICGYLQARLGEESFSWVGDVRTMYPPKLLRGEAIHPIKTVHPQEWPGVRVYLEEELQKSAETLVGKPLLLDHERVLDGEVLAARYEDGRVEYVARLDDSEIVEKVKNHEIKHCSVEYKWDMLQRVNGVAPRGIEFIGLSLLERYEPGDPFSSVEVWEAMIRKLKEAEHLTPPNPVGSETVKTLSEQEDEREKLRKAQQERSEKYGITPKEGGHLTKPEEYKDIPDDQFADPVNYRYPIDPEHVRAALTYFNQADSRSAGGYSHEEQAKIMAKIITAALGNGIEVRYQPLDTVYRDLPESPKKKLQGYEDKSQEAQKVIEALQNQISVLLGQKKTLEEAMKSAEERIRKIEVEKPELAKRVGSAIVEPEVQEEDLRQTVLRELKGCVFERVPQHWGYGPFEQNRRIRELIRRLER